MIRLGVSPVGWSNEDHPALGGDVPFERILDEAAAIGFSGIELGSRFPQRADELARVLSQRGLRLVSAWASLQLLERRPRVELELLKPRLDLLEQLDTRTLVVAEGTGSVIRDETALLSRRPRLHPETFRSFGGALTELADAVASRGLQLVYHHHMGTVIQTDDDVDELVAHTGDSVGLAFDTGHALFAGIDPVALVKKHRRRIRHVHIKDVRAHVLRMVEDQGASFVDTIKAGVFAPPGDGDAELEPPMRALLETPYEGWVVVEADQDPAVHPAEPAARRGFDFTRKLLRSD